MDQSLNLLTPGLDLPPALGGRLNGSLAQGRYHRLTRATEPGSRRGSGASRGSRPRPAPAAPPTSWLLRCNWPSLQRVRRLALQRPLRFELYVCGFARAAPGSEAGFYLRLPGIGRFPCPLECRGADWCVLCRPCFFPSFRPYVLSRRSGG